MEGASSAPPPSASPQQFAPASRRPPPAGRLPPPSMEEAPRTVAGKDWKPAGFPPLPVFSSSRRALLDPSMFSTVLYSTRIKRHNIPQAITVLEDVIGVLIRHMWRAHQEFNFWNLLSEGSVAQRLSFFAFKRGPLHLGGTVYAALRSFTPHNHILNCANGLISSKLSVFKTIQSSLSVFLAEAYRELITYEDKIDGDPVMLMEELSVFLTNSICKLEISLSNTGDEALLEKAGYDADITIDAIGDKIVFLDSFLSLLIDAHKKPSHFTLNWMAYTCGMVTVAGCSLWLLRHRSMVENHAAHSWHAIKAAAVNFWENCLKHPVAVIAKEISSVSENIKEVSGKQDLFGGDYNMWRKLFSNACTQNICSRVHCTLCLFNLAGYMLHCRSLYSFFETKNVAMHGIDQSEDAMMTRLNVIFNEHTDTFMDIFSGEVGQAFLIQVQKFFLDGEALFVQVDELIAENRVLLAAFALFLLLLPRFVVGVSTIPWKCIQRRKAEAMAIAHKKRKCSLYEDIKERISRIQELTVLVETQFLIAEEVGLLIYAIAMLHVQAAQLLGDTGDVMSLQENMRSILRPDSGFEQQMISVDQLDNVMMGRASR